MSAPREGRPKRFIRLPELPKITKRHIIAFAACVVLGVFGYVLLGAVRFFVVPFLLLCIWGFGQRKLPSNVFLTCLVVIFGLGTAPVYMYSNSLWKYPFQRIYIGCYRNIREPEWFPDFYDDVKGDFEFDYSASVMQGTGHYSVLYETDADGIKRVRDEFEGKAQYVFTVGEFSNGSIYDGRFSELDKEKEENINASLTFYLGSRYSDAAYGKLTDDLKNDIVFILSSNLDFNHPKASAIVIDTDNNTVFLSQLG